MYGNYTSWKIPELDPSTGNEWIIIIVEMGTGRREC